MFEDHQLIRRAAVQCFTNLCASDLQVARCEGRNDKVKYAVLLCGDDEDAEVVKAAAGALAMLTSRSEKICSKVRRGLRTRLLDLKKTILLEHNLSFGFWIAF